MKKLFLAAVSLSVLAGAVFAQVPNAGQPMVPNGGGGGSPTGAAGGYLSGTYPNPNVAKVLGTTTNDSAAAGDVGQYVESSIVQGSAVSLTTATAANITSISLTAGDWEVSAVAVFNGGATTTVNNLFASISQTSAALNFTPGSVFTDFRNGVAVFASNTITAPIPPVRISLSATTTIYLVGQMTFGTSTANAYGLLRARRER